MRPKHLFGDRDQRSSWNSEQAFLKDLYETLIDKKDIVSAIQKIGDRRYDITGIQKCLCYDIHFLDEPHP